MGIGGAPEGVLTAAAMRCLNGEIFGRLMVTTPSTRGAARWDFDFRKVHLSRPGLVTRSFSPTGVTEGTLMKGVRFFGDGVEPVL
jgi:fructose-1,6-bisphosphatase II